VLFRLITVIFALMIVQMTYAEEAKVENTLSGSIEVGGDNTVGNSENSSFDAKIELEHGYGSWVNQLTFKAAQKHDSGSLTEDKYNTLLKSIYNFPYQLYVFVHLGYREDSFSGIYYEKTYIGGFGYHAFADTDKYGLDFELGYGQRVTKKIVNGFIRAKLDYDPGTHIGIIGSYHFSEGDVVKASVSAELGNDDDFIKQEYTWEHKLFDALQLVVSYESLTLTNPGVGKQKTDAKTSYRLGYSF